LRAGRQSIQQQALLQQFAPDLRAHQGLALAWIRSGMHAENAGRRTRIFAERTTRLAGRPAPFRIHASAPTVLCSNRRSRGLEFKPTPRDQLLDG